MLGSRYHMTTELDKIRAFVGEDSYQKGKRFSKNDITFDYKDTMTKNNKETIHYFYVKSQHSYHNYRVTITKNNKEILDTDCDCMQFASWGSCKHVAACLIHFQEEMQSFSPENRKLLLSKQILNEFYKPQKKENLKIKKQLNLAIELEFFENYYNQEIIVKFKIGEEKLYNLNNRFSEFVRNYGQEDYQIAFGKNFTYDSTKHFFSKSDENIIKYFVDWYKKDPYNDFKHLVFTESQFESFLKKIEEVPFTIKNYGRIDRVVRENPLQLELQKGEKYYKLSFLENDYDFLTEDCRYVVKNYTLYEIPLESSKIISLMQQNGLHDLEFKEEDLEVFNQGILPRIKQNIILDKTVEDKIILGVKPEFKIYFDIQEGIVLCDVVAIYQNQEINYFEENSHILRDELTENQVIEELFTYGFFINNKKLYLDDIDSMGEFLETHLLELAKKYEIYTSDKMKATKIIKENPVTSMFSIGTDNIMKYEFNYGEIDSNEILDVLEGLKGRKRYYRLKNGSLIDLTNNNGLREYEKLINDMDLTAREVRSGSGVIPKYRAIYLDSIKKEKYHIIKTNNLFDELVQNFNAYKDLDISLNEKDKKILRDYQVTGVKWLYNIYKCGLGGILADEMGLGKSIQLIYFIKQIIKEQKDAKILIVAPTSLIYNWKKEFDKFGSEIKYKVLAENRKQRKSELESLEETQVCITTYGLLRKDKEIYEKISFELIALDEAQYIKNNSAQMTKTVKSLNAKVKIALTGTPLENSVLELWSIFDFIMPGYLANNLKFQRKYNIKDVEKEDLEILNSLNMQIKPFILRRKKKDVVKELPDKIENNIMIELNQEQKKLYIAQLEKTKKEMTEIVASEGFKKGSFKILQLLTRLRQVCIDPNLIFENYQGVSSKIENLIQITKGIIENGHKILLFTSFKTALDIVNREFTNQGISTYAIDGSVSSKKRMELVEKFNQDNTNAFLITLKAGGTGLNLTSADVVIHLDLWWNPQVENQATDRAHRIGQTKTVEVIKLICKGTIEERIMELQKKKKILSDALIEGKDRDSNILSKLTEKDIKNLLAIDNEEEE